MRRIVKLNNPCKKKHSILQKFKSLIIMSVIMAVVTVGCLCIDSIPALAREPEQLAYAVRQKSPNLLLAEKLQSEIELYNDSIASQRELLIDEVWTYMIGYYPKTKMSPEHIVDICLENEYDIPLLLSQARLESVFGKRTGGTKSCFGVVSRRYTTCDESVTDYVRIMQKHYIRTRTPEQLIASGFYMEGSRKYKYASDPNYSKTIGHFRTTIIKRTGIAPLYNNILEMQKRRDSLTNELCVLQNQDIKKAQPEVVLD